MAVCFETRKSTLDADLVLDSQFYNPRKLEYLNQLNKKSRQKISDEFPEIVDLTSSQAKLSLPSFIYDLTDSLGNLFTDGKIANSADDIGSTKKIAQPNDFAVSRLRYYLKEFGVVPKRDYPPLLSTEYVVLRKKGKILPHLLIPYFLLSEIQFIFEHSQRGSEHPRLANKDILSLPLPDSLVKKAKEISNIVDSAIENFKQSKKLYPEAERELLKRIEWDKVKTSHVLNYTATSKDIMGDERLDPEFYQPKFANLEKHLKKIGAIPLSVFCPEIRRGVSPVYTKVGEAVIVNSQNLSASGVIATEELEKAELSFYRDEKNKKARLKQFDVLVYATGAYIGRTNCWLENMKAIAGIDCLIIQPNAKICDPVYLALFLNLQAGLMQANRRASGSAQRHLYPNDLMKYLVFVPRDKNGRPDLAWQKKLAEKVVAANEAKKSAKQKLQEAKNVVEQEIEKLIN